MLVIPLTVITICFAAKTEKKEKRKIVLNTEQKKYRKTLGPNPYREAYRGKKDENFSLMNDDSDRYIQGNAGGSFVVEVGNTEGENTDSKDNNIYDYYSIDTQDGKREGKSTKKTKRVYPHNRTKFELTK